MRSRSPGPATGDGDDGKSSPKGKDKDDKDKDDDDDKKGKGAGGLKIARVVVFDEQTGDVLVAFRAPRLGAFTQIGLVAHGDGTFVLVGQLPDNNHWKAIAFRLTKTGDVEWTGSGKGEGLMIGDPFQTNLGALLPVAADGKVRFIRLDDQIKSERCEGPEGM